MGMTGKPRARNRLLDALSDADYDLLAEHLRPQEMKLHDVLYEAEDEVDTVWFPETGMASVISVMLDGDMIETAVIGREGCVGLTEACGSGVTFSRVIVQGPGRFWRAPTGAWRDAFGRSSNLRILVHDHLELMMTEARQVIACRNLHAVEQRLAWWLLECQDRLGDGRLPLTQEFLAVMLGVQRTTVTEHASQLQEEGLIRYRRGLIELVDRHRLEERACECYGTTQHFRQIIEERWARNGLRRRA